jgi:two-component system KDP operon response regulator KdpE
VTLARPRILMVEDDPRMRRLLRTTLVAHGYAVTEALTAREGLSLATQHMPELILLDLGLPDGDGLGVTQRLREWSEVPVIVISARGREQDKVEALDAGADDYVTKPFGTDELLARIRVALRHASRSPSASGDPTIVVGPITIDPLKRVVLRAGLEVHLTPIEYRLLLFLAKNVDRVLTHRQILREVWGPSHTGQSEYLRVYMLQLRRKLEEDPARPRLLVTDPGVGYRLRDVGAAGRGR